MGKPPKLAEWMAAPLAKPMSICWLGLTLPEALDRMIYIIILPMPTATYQLWFFIRQICQASASARMFEGFKVLSVIAQGCRQDFVSFDVTFRR